MTKSIGFSVTHRYMDVDISEQEWQYILELASWKRMPSFAVRGRSAWHILREDVSLKSPPHNKLRAAKLKGIGVWNPASAARNRDSLMVPVSETPIPPTTQPLESFATYPHFGLTAEGEYALVYGKVAPVGGIVYERALLEFESAKLLIENGLSTIVPLAVIRYEDKYQFQGQAMGAVISLSPAAEPYRLSEIQFGAATRKGEDPLKDAYCERIRDSLGIQGDFSCETTRLAIIKVLSQQLGQLIHDFTAAGLYRYSPEWTNLEYNFDTCQVLLTDLDSTRPLAELTPELQTLHALRDVGSLLYRTMAKFATPSALDKYTLTNLLKYDPITDLLIGYFPQASEEQLQLISKRLWNAFIPYMFLLKKHRHAILNEWTNERRRSYKMDHDLFYLLAMSSIYPLFCESDLAHLYPSEINMDKLLKKAETYLGERYEYFLYLLKDSNYP